MGSYGSWLLLVALLSLTLICVNVGPIYCQHAEDYRWTFFVAIKSNDTGLEVHTLFPEKHDSVNNNQRSDHARLEPQMLFIPGHNLSSECGDQYFRCEQLLTETVLLQDGNCGVLNVVFVPLEKGIMLLSYSYDSNILALTMDWSIHSSNCSPIVFYKVSNKVYMVCISSELEDSEIFTVYMYEVRLKLSGSVVEDLMLMGPLTKIGLNYYSLSNMSDLILVEDEVYFTFGNTIMIIAMDVNAYNSTFSHQYFRLPQCTQIHKIVPTVGAENNILVVYCADRYIYVDPVYNDWTEVHLISEYAVPYICSDNYKAIYNSEDSILNLVTPSSIVTINNVNISSGVCFKSDNKTYFAYSNQQDYNVYVYDFTTQNRYPVSVYDCPSHVHQDCPQLLLLDSDYLIVRDADYSIVLDITTNFNLIINISSGIVDILAVLHSINIHSVITPRPSPPIAQSTISEEVPQNSITSTMHTDMITSTSPHYNATLPHAHTPAMTTMHTDISTSTSPHYNATLPRAHTPAMTTMHTDISTSTSPHYNATLPRAHTPAMTTVHVHIVLNGSTVIVPTSTPGKFPHITVSISFQVWLFLPLIALKSWKWA